MRHLEVNLGRGKDTVAALDLLDGLIVGILAVLLHLTASREERLLSVLPPQCQQKTVPPAWNKVLDW